MIRVGHCLWEWRGKKWAHLWDDQGDLDALMQFAVGIGMRAEWLQTDDKTRNPKYRELAYHFDVTGSRYRLALSAGAVPTDELEYWREKEG